MKSLQYAYEGLLSEFNAQVCMVWDDDMLYSPEGLRELRGHLQELVADRLEALSLFLWDKQNTYNRKMLTHWGPVLFRVYPNDDFPLHFVVACPEAVARSDYVERLNWPVLNFGYLTDTDRQTAWATSRESGRIDNFTLSLIREPELAIWQSQDVPQLTSKPSPSPAKEMSPSK